MAYVVDGEYRAPRAVLRRLLDAGETQVSIARLHEVPEHCVRYRCAQFGLRKPRGKAPGRDALVMALSHADIPMTEIARAYGVQPSTVAKAAKRHGLPTDEDGRRGLMEARS